MNRPLPDTPFCILLAGLSRISRVSVEIKGTEGLIFNPSVLFMLSAPYLHHGGAGTLSDVLDNATHMGAVLTVREKEELTSYLLQIDDSE